MSARTLLLWRLPHPEAHCRTCGAVRHDPGRQARGAIGNMDSFGGTTRTERTPTADVCSYLPYQCRTRSILYATGYPVMLTIFYTSDTGNPVGNAPAEAPELLFTFYFARVRSHIGDFFSSVLTPSSSRTRPRASLLLFLNLR